MTATSIFALVLATQAAPIPDRPGQLPVQIVPMPPPMSALPPPPAPSPGGVAPRRARANLASYFSQDDYPAAALRGKEQGMSGFRLQIGPDGRVAGCAITQSSGFASLDSATCRILRSRARYSPARDLVGNAVYGSDSGRVAWRLPEDPFDPLLEAEASETGPIVASPKPPRPRSRAGPRPRPPTPAK